MSDREFLEWLRDRLVHVYGESLNVDFVQKLGKIAGQLQEPSATLERYGLQWNGPDKFVATPMADGYWTPWHIANQAVKAAQAQVGEGEVVGWQYQHEDTGRTTFVTHAEVAAFEELNPRWHKTIPLYAAPPAAVNQQLLEALHKVRDLLNGWQSDLASVSMSIDVIDAAIAAAQEQPQDGTKQKYTELLYAVSTKHPGETRHETALRYIRQAENSDCQAAAQEQK